MYYFTFFVAFCLLFLTLYFNFNKIRGYLTNRVALIQAIKINHDGYIVPRGVNSVNDY